MNKVAVVILNWNGIIHLKKFLPTVMMHSKNEFTSIFVADNGSTDNSIEYIENEFPSIKIIRLDKNYGFALGYVKALREIDFEYFILLNSDIEVTANWIDPLVEAMDRDTNIGACMPKIKAYNKKDSFEYAGASGGFIDKFGYPFCRGRILNSLETDNGQYDEIKEIFWASGASLFVRAKAYFESGELDEDFFAHMEEIDLCWRMQNKGYRIVCVPSSVVYHVGGGTLPNNTPRKIYLNYRNNLYLLYKNLPEKNRYSIVIIRLLIDCASASIYLLNFNFSFYAAVVKAHISFLKAIPNLKKKRAQLQSLKSNFKLFHIYPSSILFQFFIKRKRKFSDLIF